MIEWTGLMKQYWKIMARKQSRGSEMHTVGSLSLIGMKIYFVEKRIIKEPY